MATIRKRTWKTTTGAHRTAWIVDFLDKNGERGRKQFSKKADADTFRIALEDNLKKGLTTVSLKSPLEDVAAEYLKHCALRVENGSMTQHNYVVYEGHVRNYIAPDPTRHNDKHLPSRMRQIPDGIGQIKAGEISRSDVTKFRDVLRDAGVSVQTTRKILGTLRQLCEFAIERGLMIVNPVDGVRVIGRRDEAYKKIAIPPVENVRRVLDAAHPELWIRIIFAAATGVRAGEMHAVTWGQIDLQSGNVCIDRRVDIYGSTEVTKTVAGMREIPLGRMLTHELRKRKKVLRATAPDDLVFPDTDGSPLRHDVMIKRWYNAAFTTLQKAHKADPIHILPAPARFRWHDLRHFAISTWIAAGLQPKVVQTLAGHSSIQVTMDRYGHLFPDDSHHETMTRIEGRIWPETGSKAALPRVS